MGKASKWIRNFLLGKRETDKKKEDSNSENARTAAAIVARAPKTRWSFGRSANKQVHHRRTRSSSFSSNGLAKHEIEEFETKPNYDKAIVLLPNANVKRTTKLMQKVKAREAEEGAAIKIQAVFRAYSKRNWMFPPKHEKNSDVDDLVGKKSFARFEGTCKATSIGKRLPSEETSDCNFPMYALPDVNSGTLWIGVGPAQGAMDIMNMNFDDTWGVFQGQMCYPNQPQMERTGNEYDRDARNLSMLEHENQLQMYPTSPSLTYRSFNGSMRQLENNLAKPRSKSTRDTFTFPQPEFIDPVSNDHPFIPSFMANTESSRAKARSQSEPKQRPKWRTKQASHQQTPSGELNVMQITPKQWPQSLGIVNAHENTDPWLSISHRLKTSLKDSDCDSTSTNLSNPSQYRSQVAHIASNR
ncbi:protein of unknown function DUF4005 [Dillenia turbinata]|uniref:DUF4005 domain-containing protein n=1 Tax=Dillenia turbinata TaxID=194707 RepID=A0AAN8YWB2_9MAGN